MLVSSYIGLVEDVEGICGFPPSSTCCCVHSMCLETEACERRASEASTGMMFCDHRCDVASMLKLTEFVCLNVNSVLFYTDIFKMESNI